MSSDVSKQIEAIDLSDAERSFMHVALTQWSGPASYRPLPIQQLFGISDWAQFDALTARLAKAITNQQPLSPRDWAIALFLSELSFASDLVGTGTEFALFSHSDEEGIRLLRAIQHKLSSSDRAELLFPGAGRPPKDFDHKTSKESTSAQ